MSQRGFTLLEVLVAISILGLGLTVILSSQTGMFASTTHAENLTHATFLARCKMTETELALMTEGYPLIDETDTGACCEDDESEFSCSWKVELIELPQPGSLLPPEEGAEGTELAEGTDVPGTLDPLAGSTGGLGVVSSMHDPSGTTAGDPLSALAEVGSGEGAAGIGAMVMSMVYPDLKPMLEASIRKVTVSVRWPEGSSEKELTVVQYVTDPQQGGLLDTGEDSPLDPAAAGPAAGEEVAP